MAAGRPFREISIVGGVSIFPERRPWRQRPLTRHEGASPHQSLMPSSGRALSDAVANGIAPNELELKQRLKGRRKISPFLLGLA